MEPLIELGNSTPFSSLRSDELQLVTDSTQTLELSRGNALFKRGDKPSSCFLILNGRFIVTLESPDGRETILGLIVPGEVIGEMGLFSPESKRSAGARAIETSTVLEIPYSVFSDLLDKNRDFLFQTTKLMAARVVGTSDARADAFFLDVTGRTAKTLLRLSDGREIFEMPLTQEELAALVGASRERINKAIATMERLGWLERSDRSYRIMNRAELENRSR